MTSFPAGAGAEPSDPLMKLAALDGWVLLMGTGLDKPRST